MFLAVYNQRLYPLKLLRDRLSCCSHNVYVAVVVNRIVHCFSAWVGFSTDLCKGRINAVFNRAKRFGVIDTIYDVTGLREYAVFLNNQIQFDFHCLYIMFHILLNLMS